MSIPGISKLRAKDLIGSAALHHEAPGLTDADIATLLGISKTRAYQLRLRAIAKFRQGVLADPVLRQLAEEVCGHAIE